jgi:hypothetical protein
MGARPVPNRRTDTVSKALLIAEILGAYVVTRWRMSRIDVRGVLAAARRPSAIPRRAQKLSPREAWEVGVRLGRAVDRTLTVLPTDSRCLVQSLVLSRLLATRDIPTTLVIGAHPKPKFEAHAWVEYHGRAVLPPLGFQEFRLLEL